MVFSNLFFLYAFLPASLLGYVLCRSLKAKNICLLVFSLVFYAWGEPKYVLLLAGMALFDWAFALRICADQERGRTGKVWLILACVVDLGLIGFFKYSGMICSVFGEPPAFISRIGLPLGISFYTFQLLTYVVDVYRGEAQVQRQYWHVLLYAALFHQCIAGPIVRYQTVADELFVRRSPAGEIPQGVMRFTVGLAKKVMLANPCGALADSLWLTDAAIGDVSALATNLQQLSQRSVLGLWVGLLAFSLQIYYDFSAYSDMAIGMGKMLGLHYPENFDHPYVSRSVTEFWRRWHMSLGTFFRDYVYIPLGGSRRGGARTMLNLLVVWALTGLWHGGNWSFVLWGLYYFVFAAMERLFLRKWLDWLPGPIAFVLCHLYLPLVVMLGWVLFKFTELPLAWTVLRGLFGANGNPLTDFQSIIMWQNNAFLLCLCVVAVTPLWKDLFALEPGRRERETALRRGFRRVVYATAPTVLLLLSTACLVGNSYNPFLYFKF